MLQLNCNLRTMMQYVHCLRNIHNQSTANCRQIICVDIEVEYFCNNVIITTRHRYVFFCKYNARNLVWNWYGRLSSIPFLKSSIPFWHLPYSIPKFPFHSIFHSIPCPGLGGHPPGTPQKINFLNAQLRVPVCYDIRRYLTDNYFDSTFLEVS